MDLKNLCTEPELAALEKGSAPWFAAQRDIILRKPLLKRTYDHWYKLMLEDARTVPRKKGSEQGMMIELGAGASYIKQFDKRVITSDVVPGVADRTIDATQLPFPNSSVSALFLTQVFHHIPEVESFLEEAQRVLVPRGVISMTEPTSTPFSCFFLNHFHPEPHLPKAPNWTFAWEHNMLNSNQALSWIVFCRDRKKFEKKYPQLRVEIMEYLPWFSYLCSGGVSRKTIIPSVFRPLLIGMDYVLKPFDPLLSLIWHIRIRKIKG